VVLMVAAGFSVVGARLIFADGSGDPAAVKKEDGKYYDKEGNPTFKVQSDGTVDWYTYSGFRRYHSDCHVCHGPDGEGSSYAPALSNSLKTMNYPEFANVVVNGRKNVNTARRASCRRSALIRTSCAISMTYSSICGRAPTTPSRADDRTSTKTSPRRRPKRKTVASGSRAEGVSRGKRELGVLDR